jgi:HK97 family phage major capsid protein
METVKIQNMESEFLKSIEHLPTEQQELCKAVRQQTLGTVKAIQADIELEKKDIDAKIDALKSEHQSNVNAMNVIKDILAKHGTTLTGLKNQSISKEQYDSIGELISKAINENENALKSIPKGQEVDLTIKTNYLRSSVTSSTQAMRLDGYGLIGYKQATMYNLFPKVTVGPESNGTIRYIDQTTATRSAAGVAENGTFPESTLVWTEYTLTLEKIGDTIPISEEAVKDTARLAGEVEKFLQLNIDLKVNTDLTVGNGTTPNIKGLYTYAPTYTAAASGITGASTYDLLVKMKENIVASYGGKYAPNFAVMSTAEINKMKLKKDTNQNYVQPPFANGVMVVDGMVIIENNDMAANTVVIGDSRFGTIYELEGYTVSVGYSGTQFVNDMMTLKARKRLALLIRTADQTGFIKCTSISAALTTLAT